MSIPTVTTTLDIPGPTPTTVGSIQELATIYNSLLHSEITGDWNICIVQEGDPGSDQSDIVWGQKDSAGRPVALKLLYQGAWRQFYTGLPNEIRMFSGDPGTYFDSTGLGLIVPGAGAIASWDGWAICNGSNGTPNLSNLFIVGGRMDNVGGDGYSATGDTTVVPPTSPGWVTGVTGTAANQGGGASTTLINDHLPEIVVQLTGFSASDASHSDKQAIVTGAYNSNTNAGQGNTIDIQRLGPNSTLTPPEMQRSVPTVPPFYALAYCQFKGYA